MSETKTKPIDLVLAASALGLLCYLFFPTLRDIAVICWNDDDYSHGLLLPFVAAYMIWDRRTEIAKKLHAVRALASRDDLVSPSDELAQRLRLKERAYVIPLFLLLAGLFLFFLGYISDISFTRWLAFFPTTFAVIYLLFGRTLALTLAPPLLLLFMAKPMPDSLVVRLFWPLQVLAAKVSAMALSLAQVPVYLSGNIIEIPSMRLLVEEACSGMRSCMALLTLAFILLYFIDLRWLSRIALVLSAFFVAVLLNVFRVTLTGFLAHFYDPAAATGFFHEFSGLVVFMVALPLLYLSALTLVRIEKLFPTAP